jgi:hypothetical protein
MICICSRCNCGGKHFKHSCLREDELLAGKDGAIRSKRFDMHWIWEFYKLVDKLLRIAVSKTSPDQVRRHFLKAFRGIAEEPESSIGGHYLITSAMSGLTGCPGWFGRSEA